MAATRFRHPELLAELEDIDRHVAEDSHYYWAKHALPTDHWQRRGPLLALHDDAHAALRATSREATRERLWSRRADDRAGLPAPDRVS
jgi:flagellar biosynthesis regulator FlbT